MSPTTLNSPRGLPTACEINIRLFIYRKLKRLNLGGNVLTSVPQKALSILDMLKKLEMQENRITEIREGDFEGKSLNCSFDSVTFDKQFCVD